MSRKIDLIVFDMAGTTVLDQREVEKCFFEAIERTSLETSHEEINSMMGWSKISVFETLWANQLKGRPEAEIKKKVNESYGYFKSILEKHYLVNDVFATPGTIELFNFLQTNNIKIALDTGFYRSVTDIILRKLGWMDDLDANYAGEGLINASVASDQVRKGRPAPYMIFRAMELCGVTDVRRVIKIGDTPSDLEEGKNAGCLYSFGVTNGTHSQSELEEYESNGLFSSMSSFHEFIENKML